jgi:predicted AAA+ superfamily ATPase
VTTQKYAGLFERLYLTRLLRPWANNDLTRLIKTPKLHFLDSGLLAALRELSPQRLSAERCAFGALLVTFVFPKSQLASWRSILHISHYRVKVRN